MFPFSASCNSFACFCTLSLSCILQFWNQYLLWDPNHRVLYDICTQILTGCWKCLHFTLLFEPRDVLLKLAKISLLIQIVWWMWMGLQVSRVSYTLPWNIFLKNYFDIFSSDPSKGNGYHNSKYDLNIILQGKQKKLEGNLDNIGRGLMCLVLSLSEQTGVDYVTCRGDRSAMIMLPQLQSFPESTLQLLTAVICRKYTLWNLPYVSMYS